MSRTMEAVEAVKVRPHRCRNADGTYTDSDDLEEDMPPPRHAEVAVHPQGHVLFEVVVIPLVGLCLVGPSRGHSPFVP